MKGKSVEMTTFYEPPGLEYCSGGAFFDPATAHIPLQSFRIADWRLLKAFRTGRGSGLKYDSRPGAKCVRAKSRRPGSRYAATVLRFRHHRNRARDGHGIYPIQGLDRAEVVHVANSLKADLGIIRRPVFKLIG